MKLSAISNAYFKRPAIVLEKLAGMQHSVSGCHVPREHERHLLQLLALQPRFERSDIGLSIPML